MLYPLAIKGWISPKTNLDITARGNLLLMGTEPHSYCTQSLIKLQGMDKIMEMAAKDTHFPINVEMGHHLPVIHCNRLI
jgi:hypothetical protein